MERPLTELISELWATRYEERKWRMSEVRNCMIPHCARVAARRGLCLVCYGKAKAKVDAGETTWEALAQKGLCESYRDPFDSAYDRAMMEDN